MKLQLNLPAMERLLGGDTELEVQLREQVVEEFAKKRLKTLLNDNLLQKVSKEWESQLNEAIELKLKELKEQKQNQADDTWTESRIYFNFKNAVEKAAQRAVDEAIRKIVEYQNRYWGKEINDAVSKALNQQIEQLVERGIQERLTAAKQIKE